MKKPIFSVEIHGTDNTVVSVYHTDGVRRDYYKPTDTNLRRLLRCLYKTKVMPDITANRHGITLDFML
jgi:hypothetical protein